MTPQRIVGVLVSTSVVLCISLGIYKSSQSKTLREKIIPSIYSPLSRTDEQWEKLWEKYSSSETGTKRLRILPFQSSSQKKEELIEACDVLLDTSTEDKDIYNIEVEVKNWCIKEANSLREERNTTGASTSWILSSLQDTVLYRSIHAYSL